MPASTITAEMSPAWPHRLLARESTSAQAQALSAELVELFGPDPYVWLASGGFELVEQQMSHFHGLLQPFSRDRFRVVVDPRSLPSFAAASDEERRRVIICHEIARSFFFERRPAARPERRWPINERWEEIFCDAFASAVTGCPQQQEEAA